MDAGSGGKRQSRPTALATFARYDCSAALSFSSSLFLLVSFLLLLKEEDQKPIMIA